MKVNAPKKLYLSSTCKLGDGISTGRLRNTNIEYTRTDAFIKKACDYLSYHLDTSKIDANYKFDFIEEFRKYMKGE